MNNLKFVRLCIFISPTDAVVEISTKCEGIVASFLQQNKYSNVCFCTRSKKIKIVARRGHTSQIKNICLSPNFCRSMSIGFVFLQDSFHRLTPTQTFYLFDKNYNIPIKSAVLVFKEQ